MVVNLTCVKMRHRLIRTLGSLTHLVRLIERETDRWCRIATASRDACWRQSVRSLPRSPADPGTLRLTAAIETLGKRRWDEASPKQRDESLAMRQLWQLSAQDRDGHGKAVRRKTSPQRSHACTCAGQVHDDKRTRWMRAINDLLNMRADEASCMGLFVHARFQALSHVFPHVFSHAARSRGPRIARVTQHKMHHRLAHWGLCARMYSDLSVIHVRHDPSTLLSSSLALRCGPDSTPDRLAQLKSRPHSLPSKLKIKPFFPQAGVRISVGHPDSHRTPLSCAHNAPSLPARSPAPLLGVRLRPVRSFSGRASRLGPRGARDLWRRGNRGGPADAGPLTDPSLVLAPV